jgi:hypothetical protein
MDEYIYEVVCSHSYNVVLIQFPRDQKEIYFWSILLVGLAFSLSLVLNE